MMLLDRPGSLSIGRRLKIWKVRYAAFCIDRYEFPIISIVILVMRCASRVWADPRDGAWLLAELTSAPATKLCCTGLQSSTEGSQ